MSSVQGRFTSVDPDGIGAAITEPQSWNGYSYVGNRPTTLTDPDGLLWALNTRTGELKWYGAPEEFAEAYKADSGWTILDGKIFIATKSGVANGTDFKAGHKYYLDASGEAVDLGLNYDPVRDFANQMGLRAAATKQMIGIFGLGGAVIGATGGAGAYYLGFSFGAGVTTLGLGGATTVTTAGAVTVTFTSHGAIHALKEGLSQIAVESAIRTQVQAIAASATMTGQFWGKVVVQGVTIIYRAYTLADGTIKIGTYYDPTQK